MMKLNKEPKTIIIDEQEYKLQPLNLNMMEQVEDKFDLAWDELVGKMRIKVLRYILYICLRPNNPDLTEEKVGEMITADSLMDTYIKAIKG